MKDYMDKKEDEEPKDLLSEMFGEDDEEIMPIHEEPKFQDMDDLLEDGSDILSELFGGKEAEEEKPKGKWMGICYESEIDQEIGKHYA